MPAKLTTDEFITRCKRVDQGKYTYVNTKYIDMNTLLEATCTEHGVFVCSPPALLRGKGCKHCNRSSVIGKLAMSKEEFIDRAKSIHGDKYDYSNIEFNGFGKKVTLQCTKHGEFTLTGRDHIYAKSGCRKCSGNYITDKDEYIAKARAIHGDQYDYSLITDYRVGQPTVTVICPLHGEYQQGRLHHLRGGGCQKCGYIKQTTTKIKKNLVTDPADRDPFVEYRRQVRLLSNANYVKYYYDINPQNLRRGKDYHLDHIIPIMQGFLDSIPPDVIASPSNLRIIPAKDNQSKGVSSTADLSQYNEYDIKTSPLSPSAAEAKRLKGSKQYEITNSITGEQLRVQSIGDWCSAHGYSVSSARWNANYGKHPFMEIWNLRSIE